MRVRKVGNGASALLRAARRTSPDTGGATAHSPLPLDSQACVNRKRVTGGVEGDIKGSDRAVRLARLARPAGQWSAARAPARAGSGDEVTGAARDGGGGLRVTSVGCPSLDGMLSGAQPREAEPSMTVACGPTPELW